MGIQGWPKVLKKKIIIGNPWLDFLENLTPRLHIEEQKDFERQKENQWVT